MSPSFNGRLQGATSSKTVQARVVLKPKLTPGQLLRYALEFRTATEGRSSGVLEDPQAPTQSELSSSAVVAVEVMGLEPAQGAATSGEIVRLRATFEKASATGRSDTFDPDALAAEDQVRKLEGRTIEYRLEPDGVLTEAEEFKSVLADAESAAIARDWLAQIIHSLPQTARQSIGGPAAPRAAGIAVGEVWSAEQAVADAPFTGLVWRAESRYLRDEPCRTPAAVGAPLAAPLTNDDETCAVILTRMVVGPRSAVRPGADRTPDEYRRRGLRTSGSLAGSGESLRYISLRTGLLVSLTQSSTEQLDLTVTASDGASRQQFLGRIRNSSQISLLPDSPR